MRRQMHHNYIPSLRGELDPLPSFKEDGSSSFRKDATLLEGAEVAGWFTCFVLYSFVNEVHACPTHGPTFQP